MNAIIHNASRTTAIGAEDIAKTGYHQPHLILGTVGRINLISPDDGKTVLQTIDMIQKKKEAWAELLPKLQEQGIDTSLPFMQKPFEASINDNIGITWDKEGLTVSAWVGEYFKDLEWNKGSLNTKGDAYEWYTTSNKYPRIATVSASFVHKSGSPTWDAANLGECFTEGSNYLLLTPVDIDSKDKLRNYLTGKEIVYQLETPIRIPFRDSNLNLNFSNVHPESLLALDDIDGNRMTRIDVTYRTEADGRYRDTDIRWNEDWLAAHPGQFPQSLQTLMTGMGWKADYHALYKLYQRLQSLELEVANLKK